jgi:hypothetical protein
MRPRSGLLRLAPLAGVLVAGMLPATTLQQLSTPEMARKSTAIVRAKVTGSHSEFRGAEIWTFYQLQVLEEWKSAGSTPAEAAVPGGSARGIRQTAAGAPTLSPGQDYVLFLWTGKSGITQIIGLSQGLFTVGQNADGELVARRPAASEPMLDQSGLPVADQPLEMPLSDLHALVAKSLGTGQ